MKTDARLSICIAVKSSQKDCKRGYYFMRPRYAKNVKGGFRGCLNEM